MACDSVLQIAHIGDTMGFGVIFIVRTPKCRYDDQQENTS